MMPIDRRCIHLLCIYQFVLLIFFAYQCVGLAFNASDFSENERQQVELSKPSFKFTWSNLHVAHNDKVIIDIPAGDCSAGRLLGILGPSGSGKSTFLKSIAQKLAGNLKVKGDIYINNTSGSLSVLSNTDVAFVHQEDNFFNMLTVEETLRLALALRHLSEPSSTPSSIDNKRLLEMSTIMGLRKVLHRRVGSGGSSSSHGGISGGEKKRLSVACELLGYPKLLIADEPTSGLDSFQALQVVTALRALAQRHGIVAIATLHQPRSSIWLQCDDIMLFTPNGRIAFHGPREQVLSYLDSIGYSCPANVNPAEHMIDLVSVDPAAAEESQEAARRRIIDLEGRFLSYRNSNNNSSSQPAAAAAAEQSYNVNSAKKGDDDNSDDDHSRSHHALSSLCDTASSSNNNHGMRNLIRGAKGILSRLRRSLHRTALLFRRALLQTLRDGKTNFVRLAVSSLLATIVGSLYGDQGGGGGGGGRGGGSGHDNVIRQGSVSKRVNIVAQAVINVSMLAAVKTLQLFKTERPVVSREQGQYGAMEYLLAKAIAELPLDALVAAVFGTILHHQTRIASPRSSFVGLLSLVAAVSASLGLAVGALFPWGDTALTVGPALMVIFVITGAIGPAGVSLDDNDEGDGNSSTSVRWKRLLRPLLELLSPIRLACNALLSLEFHGREVIDDDVFDEEYTNYSGKKKRSLIMRPRFLARRILRELSQTIKAIAHSESKGSSNNSNMPGSSTSNKGGDHVLEALGIDQELSSFHSSSRGLWRLLAGHLIIALLGLLFVKGDDG